MTAPFPLFFCICLMFATYLLSESNAFIFWYQNNLYPFIHHVFYSLTSKLSFPAIGLYIVLFFLVLLWIIIKKKDKFWNILSLILSQIILFYWFWGFNYNGKTINEKFNLNRITIQDSILFEAYSAQRVQLNEMRNNIDTRHIQTWTIPELVMLSAKAQQILHIPSQTNISVRLLKPKGILLRNGISGIFMPFFHEAHVDSGLTDWEKPFVILHEMSHVAGITDEGEASFTAYIAAMQSNNYWIQYSASLEYWFMLSKQVHVKNKNLKQQEQNLLSPAVKNDIETIKANNRKYATSMAKTANTMNDWYLKSQGVQAGTKSYDELLKNILAWKIKYKQ